MDVPMALAWVPFALAVVVLRPVPGAVPVVVAATMVFSFAHQPLTLALVYGDPRQFAVRPRTFVLAPVVLAGLVWVGLTLSFTTVAVVGALWNAEHTLLQRYGLTRVYGRRVGDDHGRLEKSMLVSWLVAVLLAVVASPRTPAALGELGFGRHDTAAVEAMLGLRPVATVLLPAAALVALVLSWRWVGAERRLGAVANRAKHLYVGATALLFAAMLLDPVVGFVGYVGAHAAEYFVLVHHTLGTRYRATDDPSTIGRAVRTRAGQGGAVLGLLATLALVLWFVRSSAPPQLHATVLLTLGALHILFDGFIWKLRRPEVARSFHLTAHQRP